MPPVHKSREKTDPDQPETASEPQEDPKVPWQVAAGSGRRLIAFRGLLASDKTLRDAEHTLSEWQELLDTYLKSPRG